MVILQVDDSFIIGFQSFLQLEEHESRAFVSKPREPLSRGPIRFNGITITRSVCGDIIITQPEKIEKLAIPEGEKEFAIQRALAQYIGVNCRLDVCASVQLIAPEHQPVTKSQHDTLRKAIEHLRDSREQGLRFVAIDMDTLRIIVVSDASFANTVGMKSKLGYVVLMADDRGRANIVHFGSNRCHRVSRSVKAAEVHALVLPVDYGFVIRDAVEEIMGRIAGLEAYVDSRTLFNVFAKESSMAERRLQIDVLAFKESYIRGEIIR